MGGGETATVYIQQYNILLIIRYVDMNHIDKHNGIHIITDKCKSIYKYFAYFR